MGEQLGGWKRSMMCGEVNELHDGQELTLMGWTQRRRDLGSLMFVALRDREGLVQVVFDQSDPLSPFDKASLIKSEFVLAVKGVVRLRNEKDINPNMKTGKVELIARELKILSESETPPIQVDDDSTVAEVMRLKYRYLDLRRPRMQENLRLRARIASAVRGYLESDGFVELETPILTRPTPEGARDYLVPSRVHPGSFYALPQSPQLFKQLLMVSGFDRYYQIAPCFRDEDLRADRQPNFMQIDIEMSFADQDDVIKMGDGLFKHVFREAIGYDLQTPCPRITYREAMDSYGSDKPDTRFELKIKDVSGLAKGSGFPVFESALEAGGTVRAINAKGCAAFSRKEIDALAEAAKQFHAKGLAWVHVLEDGFKSQFLKFVGEERMGGLAKALDAETGDLLLFIADKQSVALPALGAVRLELGKKLNLMDKTKFNMLWVTEFPFFERDEETGELAAAHHAFTSPMDEDIALLDTNPADVRAKAYDIVINGVEMASGSIRIHDTDLQERMLNLLGFSKEQAWERFGFLLNAFKYGPPPHGGVAPGLDRLVMVMAGESNLREVIPFPKLQNASCPLTDAPAPADAKQLEELHIALNLEEKQ